MFSKQFQFLLIVSFFYLNSVNFRVISANTIFRFGFDFGLNVNENSFKTSLHIENEDKAMPATTNNISYFSKTSITSTPSPILTEIWSKQAQLNAEAKDKLETTRIVVSQLKEEISSVVGRSDFIAAKVKLMTRYLHHINTFKLKNTTAHVAEKRFEILQEFVQLVDDLRAPPISQEGGEHSLDYMIMKMGLEKHKLIELQTAVLKDVLQAVKVWQTYTQKQIVDVVTV